MHPRDWPDLPGMPECLVMWTIHDRPLDYPEFFVVRRIFCLPWREGLPGIGLAPDEQGRPGPIMDVVPRLARSLAEARSFVPQGRYCQPRSPGDDPFIVESWF